MRIIFSLILLTIGLVHFTGPVLFENILGILEILIALVVWVSKLNEATALYSSLLFLFLTPVYFYLTQSYIFLLLYPVLYLWALTLQEKGWIMSQRWSDLIFLHYEVDADKLQARVPFPLDLYEGKAIVSIVPFVMSHIRLPFLPQVPGLSKLLELNLRTYVRVSGKPAVYFFTLDSNHLPGVLIARWFFFLPYRWMKLRYSLKNSNYEFSSSEFEIKAKIGEVQEPTPFNTWATERYALMTNRGSRNLCGVVEHDHWKLHNIDIVSIKDNFSKMLGEELAAKSFIASSYSRELNVRFRPFKTIREIS